VALEALEGDGAASDRDFFLGKVAAARWFCGQVLPHVRAERIVCEGTTLDVMELDESTF
jgi:hypothetical protein